MKTKNGFLISIAKPYFTTDEYNEVIHVLKSGAIAQGEKTSELEYEFAKLCKTSYAVALNNGTSALHTALYVAGIKRGDEVITTPFTFVATANAIKMVDAKVVFVDIDEKTFNINPDLIRKKITKKTKALLIVDIFGQPADYSKIKQIANEYKLVTISDSAQAVGALYKEKPIGSWADITTFSFYATKNITSGEGGMITTSNKEYYKKAKLFRNHGQREGVRYDYVELGYNYRLTDIQAALILCQLKKLDFITKKRMSIAKKYDKELSTVRGIILPYKDTSAKHVYHQYTLRITKDFPLSRDSLQELLFKNNIQSVVYYPKPIYQFSHLGNNKKRDFRTVNLITSEVLSLPIYPLLTQKQQDYIISTIKSI